MGTTTTEIHKALKGIHADLLDALTAVRVPGQRFDGEVNVALLIQGMWIAADKIDSASDAVIELLDDLSGVTGP